MAGRQRTSFEKRQRERARQEKQAAKRARRQGNRQQAAESPDSSEATGPERPDPGDD
jgi:hypothetical protein